VQLEAAPARDLARVLVTYVPGRAVRRANLTQLG